MTPEAQKRLDEQAKYMEEQREKKKSKQSSNFSWEKYKPPTPSIDPLGRNLTKAEQFAKGFKGGAK